MGRIRVYGGTFNPPHRGHIQAARQAVELLHLDRLLFVPDGCPPLTKPCGGSPRPGTPGFGASGGRTKRRRFPTWRRLRQDGKKLCGRYAGAAASELPHDQLLLMGTDMLLTHHSGTSRRKFAVFATLAVMLQDREKPQLRSSFKHAGPGDRKKLNGKVKFLKNEMLPMTSTDVRRMLTFQAVGDMLPPEVLGGSGPAAITR